MTDPLRIGVVAACPFPWPRGTPVRIHGLARALGELGHQVDVVTYHLGQELADPPFRVHRTRDVGWYRRVAPGPSYGKLAVMDPLLHGVLRRVLDSGPFDILHAHHYEGLLVARFAARGRVPVVYDAHTTLESELPFYGLGLPAGLKRLLGRWGDRNLVRDADHVIAVTDDIRDRLIALGSTTPDRIDVVSNGVEIDHFGAMAPPPVLDGSRAPRIVYAGNLAAYQGVEPLLEAFRTVRERIPGVRLVLATDTAFDEYEEGARALGIRDAIDVVDGDFAGLPAVLAEADVFVNPRVVCEGIPQKNMNYLAAGRPLVTFHASSKPSVNGETGIAVTDGDTVALGDALVRVLEDEGLRHRLGAAARALVERDMTWQAQARRLVDRFRHVIARRKRG